MDNFAFSIDYNLLTDKDLDYLVDKLTKEKERRNNIQWEKDWAAVTEAMHQYIEKYGEILFYAGYDNYCSVIRSDTDYSSIGEIHVKFEES